MKAVRRIPPLKCLEAFETLAKVRSVKLAAHELCISPSAISHRIKLLENILEINLFERDGFVLTQYGEKYIQATVDSLQILRKWESNGICNRLN